MMQSNLAATSRGKPRPGPPIQFYSVEIMPLADGGMSVGGAMRRGHITALQDAASVAGLLVTTEVATDRTLFDDRTRA